MSTEETGSEIEVIDQGHEQSTEETEVVENDEPQVQDEETTEETEVVYENVEYNGNRYSIPPELKTVIDNHSQYESNIADFQTKQAQFETQSQVYQSNMQAQAHSLQEYAKLAAIQTQLEEYNNVDWNQLSQDDPGTAQSLFIAQQQLRNDADALTNNIKTADAQLKQSQMQQYQDTVKAGAAYLEKNIPGWNKEKQVELIGHGKSYGFSDNELQNIVDPRIIMALNDANLYRKSLNKATKIKSPAATPVKKVKGKAPVKVDPEKMSSKEWLAWRNKQVAANNK